MAVLYTNLGKTNTLELRSSAKMPSPNHMANDDEKNNPEALRVIDLHYPVLPPTQYLR